MKIKVTYRTSGKRAVSTVIEVSAGNIADMLKDEAYEEILKRVTSSKREILSYGYIQNIEDLD